MATVLYKGKSYDYLLESFFSPIYDQEVLELSSESLGFSELFDPADQEWVIETFLPEKIEAVLEGKEMIMFPKLPNGDCRAFYKYKIRNQLYPEFLDQNQQEKKTEKSEGGKRSPITIRVFNSDLEKIKAMAKEEGMPYQTLITSILHKVANKKLITTLQ